GRAGVDPHGAEAGPALVTEPVAPADEVELAVEVDVGLRQALRLADPRDHGRGPGAAPAGIVRESGQPELLRVLDPVGEPPPPLAVEVAHDLVVMRARAVRLDLATGPHGPVVVIRAGILPPVDLRSGEILAEDKVQVAIAVEVGGGPAGLEVEPTIDGMD